MVTSEKCGFRKGQWFPRMPHESVSRTFSRTFLKCLDPPRPRFSDVSAIRNFSGSNNSKRNGKERKSRTTPWKIQSVVVVIEARPVLVERITRALNLCLKTAESQKIWKRWASSTFYLFPSYLLPRLQKMTPFGRSQLHFFSDILKLVYRWKKNDLTYYLLG